MLTMKKSRIIEIVCAGCGRSQRVSESKVVVCDAYTCALGSCTQNPHFAPPQPPNGYVCEHILNAAGGFSGYRLRIATSEQMQAIDRAKAIRDAAFGQTVSYLN